VDSAKGLNKDYELGESEDLSTNLQQFLKHIGERMSSQNSCPVEEMTRHSGTSVQVVLPT